MTKRKRVERPGAVDHRSGGDVTRHGLQRGECDQRDQRKVLPAIGDDQRRQRRAGLAEPGAVGIDQPELRQRRVQRAIFRIVDQPPQRGVDHGRQRPGQDHQRAQEGAAAKLLVQQQCCQNADHHFDGDGDDGKPGRGDQRALKSSSWTASWHSCRGRRNCLAVPTSLASVKESPTVSTSGQPMTATMTTSSGSISSHARVVIQVPDIGGASSLFPENAGSE